MQDRSTIELGFLQIHLPEGAEATGMVEILLRPLVNKQIAAMLGISERTVIRWKRAGMLPCRGKSQVFMMDLLRFVSESYPANGKRRAS